MIHVSDFAFGGSFTLADISRVFRSSWQVHVDMYAVADPEMSRVFAHYVDQTVAAEFGDEAAFRAIYERPGGCFWVAWDGEGRLCGHVAAAVDAETRSCELWRLGVTREAQGKGVARLLCNAVLGFAASRDCTNVWLTTGMVMQGANRLYPALGYRLVQREFMAEYKSMINTYRLDISATDRQRFYDCEIAVWELKDGWIEARHGRRVLGAVNSARLWETRGQLDAAAWGALVRYLALARRGTAPFLVALGERIPLRSAFDPKKTVIRKMRSVEDELALRALFVQSWVSHLEREARTDPHLGEMLFGYVQSSLRKDLFAPFESVFVAENDGCLLGMVALTREGELKRLAVHPLARGLGLARLLVARLERRAKRSLGLERVFLTTGTFMHVARFYVRCGYRHEATYTMVAAGTRFPAFVTALQLFRKDLK
jgi:GNAT superfamily N-acetyltransferase